MSAILLQIRGTILKYFLYCFRKQQGSRNRSAQQHPSNNTFRSDSNWGSSSSFTSGNGGGNSRNGYSSGGGRGFSGGRGAIKKSPDDEFYDRDDVAARDMRLETKLFGSQQNSGINFKNYDDIPVCSFFSL